MQVLGAFGQFDPVAWARQVHPQHFANRRRRTIGHHHDLVRQQHRFVDIVRHHDHRALRVGDDLQQLVLQFGAGQRIERAERLVKQQHLGLHRQGACNADALLHAAEISPGRFWLAAVKPTIASTASVRFLSCALLSVAENTRSTAR